MQLELSDKVVIVTGGAMGIGASIVRGLAGEGAIPVIVDRDEASAVALSTECDPMRAEVMIVDLVDTGSCKTVIAETVRRRGRIDALVNNAGVNDKVGLADGSPADFEASLRRNLLHYYALAHHALPALKVARGAIVNIASKVALTGQGGTSGYAAAKGGILALTREWAAELAASGVRVNAVVPAEVMTPLYRQWLDTFPDPNATLRSIVERIPLGHRMTTPDEIASAVLFLLSARASHTTGQFVHVDGGYVHLDRLLA